MKYLRSALAAPVIAVGAVFFSIGTGMLMVAHYLAPEMKMFDRWINRVIDGSKA